MYIQSNLGKLSEYFCLIFCIFCAVFWVLHPYLRVSVKTAVNIGSVQTQFRIWVFQVLVPWSHYCSHPVHISWPPWCRNEGLQMGLSSCLLLERYRAGMQSTLSDLVAQKLSTAFWDPPDSRPSRSNKPRAPGHNVLLWVVIRYLHQHRPNNPSSSEGAEKQASEFWIYLPVTGTLPTDYTWVSS